MATGPLENSSAYDQILQGFHRLHRLTLVGKLDSPEADEVRDEMDGPWEALTDEEKIRLCKISEDLYSMTDPPGASVNTRKTAS